jgi:3-oxoacid CoA-transferase subunit A
VIADCPKLLEADDAIRRAVHDGATLMVGGFGLAGHPLGLVDALNASQWRNLVVISNNLGEPGLYLGRTLLLGKIRLLIGTYFKSNPDVALAQAKGSVEVMLVPQGTFAEAIRAGGAGLGGFYTPTAVGTALADGKESRVIDGKTYLFEKPLVADTAFVKARRADVLGNLVYEKTGRNFNPLMAMAAKNVVAEVDEIVPVGDLDPELVATPHILVDHLVLSTERA